MGKNTQGKKDSVTKFDGTFYAPQYETDIAKEVVKLQCDILTPDVLLSGPQIYGLTECLACSWRKDSVHGILDVSTAR